MVIGVFAKSIRSSGCGDLEDVLNTGESPQLVLAETREFVV